MKHFCFLTGLYGRYDPLMFERQGKSLVKAGYKVTYIVCDEKPNEYIEGINIISTGFKPKGRFDRFLHSKKVVYKTAKKIDADIYQISDPELLGLVYQLKRLGKRVVYNLREYYPDMLLNKNYIPKVLRKIASDYYSKRMCRDLKQYDAVFTVTDWILDLLRDQYGLKKAYLLTNFPLINHDYTIRKEEYMSRPDTLCYEGSIYRVSRQEKVFKALEDLPEVKYLLAGKIEESYQSIKTLPYWEKVEFIDGFDLSDLPKIFARSTISNTLRDFKNREGSLGILKIFESMEAALPVLLSNVEPYTTINAKYHCGICVNPNDTESIKDAIKYLINHKEEAYEMGQNGRKAVIEEFNWENQAALYLEVISKILQFRD